MNLPQPFSELPKVIRGPGAQAPAGQPWGRLTLGLWVATISLLLLALSPAVSGLGVVFDLAANVSCYVALPLLVLGFWAMLSRRTVLAVVAYLGLLTTAFWFFLRADWPEAATEAEEEITLLFSNVEGRADAWPSLSALVKEYEPDLIAIVEAEPPVIDAINADGLTSSTYPYRVMPQPGWNWPQVLLSRFPMTPLTLGGSADRYKFLFSFHRASLVALPQGEMILTAEHPPSPRSTAAWVSGNEKVRLLCHVYQDYFAVTGLPVVIAGDFNTAVTGYRTRLLKESAALHGDPVAGSNYGSWPSSLPAPLRLPLGRVWGNDLVAFLSREVLPAIGSDHRPILVTFRLKSKRVHLGPQE